MRAVRREGTAPEVRLRQELHRRGLRYIVERRPLKEIRTRADIVFTRAKVAVFVDGCFWHGCPIHGSAPASNAAWWQAKIQGNRERDVRGTAALDQGGWTVIRIWEHEDPVMAADRIEALVRFTGS